MKISICNINVTERIRKEINRIDNLAEDINQNGLLNPVTVMPLDDGRTDCSRQYQLLAGLRRLKAAQLLGWTEIEVNVVTPANAEEALRMEISENEQREAFTYSEKMDFARLIEEIEAAKAKERMSLGGKGGIMKGSEGGLLRAHLNEGENDDTKYPYGRTNEIVAPKVGMSRATYSRAKYVAKNAPPETIEQLDKGEKTITGAYAELRAKDKPENPITSEFTLRTEPMLESQREATIQNKTTVEARITPEIPLKSGTEEEGFTQPKPKTEALAPKDVPKPLSTNEPPKPERGNPHKPSPMDYMSKADAEAQRKLEEFSKLPPEGKIAELQRQLKEERARAASAEYDLERLKEQSYKDNYHKDGVIISLNHQIASLEAALATAEARVKELEEKYEYDKHTV